MSEIEQLLQNISGLTPSTLAAVALAGLVVGVAPSSFPLLSVAAGLAAGDGAGSAKKRHVQGMWLATGFVLGIVTVDTVLGALFGLLGFAVLRVLTNYLGIAYAVIGLTLTIIGLALWRVIHIVVPSAAPSNRAVRGFAASYLLGLPFGLSACPACTPLLLPVVGAAAFTADPVLGAALMLTFGLARGIPIVLAGAIAGTLAHLRHTASFTRWVERLGGTLMLAAAGYFYYQAMIYAGWLTP